MKIYWSPLHVPELAGLDSRSQKVLWRTGVRRAAKRPGLWILLFVYVSVLIGGAFAVSRLPPFLQVAAIAVGGLGGTLFFMSLMTEIVRPYLSEQESADG